MSRRAEFVQQSLTGQDNKMTILSESNEIVVPGQKIATGEYNAGDGVVKSGEDFFSSIVGLFSHKGDKLRVKDLAGRYTPAVGNFVIGFIEDVRLTMWTVDIRGPYAGVLLASNAVRGRFDPIKDDLRRIFKIGDVIKAEVVSFDRTRDPQLATKYQGLGKIRDGRIIEINPKHIPRLIGKKGSMISMIKRLTNSKILVGQNGRIWINSRDPEDEKRAIDAIYQVSREAHVRGLTDRIKTFLGEEED